jgi:hypothetical protein
MLFHRDAKAVMVLGLASGVTAGEVLHYPVEQLDVIDISRQVVTASDFFIPWNNKVLSNSKTNLIIQDGRAHLQLTRQKYDVIISEPSNPWMAGLAALFTRDFFELAEEIFLNWLKTDSTPMVYSSNSCTLTRWIGPPLPLSDAPLHGSFRTIFWSLLHLQARLLIFCLLDLRAETGSILTMQGRNCPVCRNRKMLS